MHLALAENLTGHNRGGSCAGTKLRGLKGAQGDIEGNHFFTLVDNFYASEAQQPFIMVGSKPSTGEQRQQTLQCFFELCGKLVKSETCSHCEKPQTHTTQTVLFAKDDHKIDLQISEH